MDDEEFARQLEMYHNGHIDKLHEVLVNKSDDTFDAPDDFNARHHRGRHSKTNEMDKASKTSKIPQPSMVKRVFPVNNVEKKWDWTSVPQQSNTSEELRRIKDVKKMYQVSCIQNSRNDINKEKIDELATSMIEAHEKIQSYEEKKKMVMEKIKKYKQVKSDYSDELVEYLKMGNTNIIKGGYKLSHISGKNGDYVRIGRQ